MKQVQRGTEDAGERAEPGEQGLGDRLRIAAGDEAEENEFENFVIRQRRVAVFTVASPQAIPMAVIVSILCGRRRGGGRLLLRDKLTFVRGAEKDVGFGGGRCLVTRRPEPEYRA